MSTPPEVDRENFQRMMAAMQQGSRVRISAWILWGEEHGDQVGKSRGTLREIHPIHRIEVREKKDRKTFGLQ